MPPNLRGWRVLVTRPGGQAEHLSALITAAGGVPLRLPLQRIEPVPITPALRQLLAAAPHDALVLFTSANAVRYALAIQPDPRAWPVVTAVIGEATAQAVTSAGLPTPLRPASNYSSEGLLALPQFAALHGRRILLVTGRKGRELLAETLRARGAAVQRAEVYQRCPLTVEPVQAQALIEQADALVVTSGEALERLIAVTPAPLRTRLFTRPLVVPGERVLLMARGLGFSGAAAVPQPMTDAGILRALATLTDNQSTGPSHRGATKNAGAKQR